MNKYSILSEKFGYSSFRPGQEEAINAVLSGTDVLAVIPFVPDRRKRLTLFFPGQMC